MTQNTLAELQAPFENQDKMKEATEPRNIEISHVAAPGRVDGQAKNLSESQASPKKRQPVPFNQAAVSQD